MGDISAPPYPEDMSTIKGKTVTFGVVASLLLMGVVPMFTGAYGSGTSYTFTLEGPNTARATANIPQTPIIAGDTLRLTGAGAFDTSGASSGGGAFTHFRPDGSIVAKGTWDVMGYQGFTPSGSPSNGKQGGELLITISIRNANTGFGFSGLTMKIISGTAQEGTTLPALFNDVACPSRTSIHLHN